MSFCCLCLSYSLQIGATVFMLQTHFILPGNISILGYHQKIARPGLVTPNLLPAPYVSFLKGRKQLHYPSNCSSNCPKRVQCNKQLLGRIVVPLAVHRQLMKINGYSGNWWMVDTQLRPWKPLLIYSWQCQLHPGCDLSPSKVVFVGNFRHLQDYIRI